MRRSKFTTLRASCVTMNIRAPRGIENRVSSSIRPCTVLGGGGWLVWLIFGVEVGEKTPQGSPVNSVNLYGVVYVLSPLR